MELIEKACEFDDDLMERYLEGEEPSEAEIKAALRKGVSACEIMPVLAGLRLQEQRHPAGSGRGGGLSALPFGCQTG
jgi:translation elongation factor EF-G